MAEKSGEEASTYLAEQDLGKKGETAELVGKALKAVGQKESMNKNVGGNEDRG